jgi:hypothetical protein
MEARPRVVIGRDWLCHPAHHHALRTRPPSEQNTGSSGGVRCSSMMHFYSGPPMHFLSGADTRQAGRGVTPGWPGFTPLSWPVFPPPLTPGLRSGDPAAIRKLSEARRAGHLGKLIAGAETWLPAHQSPHLVWSGYRRGSVGFGRHFNRLCIGAVTPAKPRARRRSIDRPGATAWRISAIVA